MPTDKEIKNMISILRSRRCPYCQEPIKTYLLSAFTVPPEYAGRNAAQYATRIDSPFALYFWGQNSFAFMERMCLTATCKCGNISWWTLDETIFEALISPELYEDGYGLILMYGKEPLQDMYDKTPDDNPGKKHLKKLLDSFEKGGKNE